MKTPRRGSLAAALALSLALAPGVARADEDDQTARDEPEERPVPDYDGRGEDPTTFGDVALWVPRIVLSPLWLVSELVIRRPLGFLVTTLESGPLDFFSEIFSSKEDFAIVPTAYFEFGFRANIGVYLFADNLLARGHDLRLHAATGGIHYWKVTLADRIELDRRGTTIALRGHASNRRDYLFHGLGPSTTSDQLSRYRSRWLEGSVRLEIPRFDTPSVEAEVGVRDRNFGRGRCCDDPALTDLVDQGEVSELPPAFESGYTAWFQRLALALDTRGYVGDHGVRLEVHGEHAFDLTETVARRWVMYGVTGGLYFRTIGYRRTVGLAAGAYFADPLGEEGVPFSEQRLLDGDGLLRGFREGRLHGRSAAALSLEYQWPIWVWLQGLVQVATGNAFGAHMSDFRPERLRGSFAIGVRTAETAPDHGFELLFAIGTETVEQGFGVDTVRLLLGATEGF